MDQLENLTALELGHEVNSNRISRIEVIDYFADRIQRRNSSINAFVYTMIDEAREQAKKDSEHSDPQTEKCFSGVPFALKDFLPSKKGWIASHGGVPSFRTIDNESSEFCKAMERLGGIAMGKTNAPAFGFRATTDNKMYGPTSTPFKVGYNSGGSSGGSCAAVADGLVPIAECGDAGGSIRVPAAWCGCFGFKPSAGLVPSICRPDAWTATHPYCCGGPATRSVEDAAALLDEMFRYDRRDPLSVVNADNYHLLDAVRNRNVSDLKIGYTLDFDLFPRPDAEIENEILNIVKFISDDVRCIDEVSFKWNYSRDDMEVAWLLGINIDDAISPKVIELVETHPDDLPDVFLKWHELAQNITIYDYKKFHNVRTSILDSHLDVLDQYDIILAPVTGCLPVKNDDNNDTRGPKFISGEPVDDLIGFAYTYLENMTGFPAASIPIGLSKEGLPIGLQVIGPRYADDIVFQICGLIEEMVNWKYNIPFNRSIS